MNTANRISAFRWLNLKTTWPRDNRI